MVNDPIADMLTQIRNANQRQKRKIILPYSKLKFSITQILKSEGYIYDYKVISQRGKRSIIINLKYKDNIRVISGLKRISKPGLRVYSKASELPKVLNGLGIAVVSTSKGVMTDANARQQHLGGEVLAYVW